MKKNSRLILVLSLMAVLALAGPTPAFEDVPASTVDKGSDYFPMATGNKWFYDRIDDFMGYLERSYYTRKVINANDQTKKLSDLWTEDKAGNIYIGSSDRWYFVASGMVGLKKIYDPDSEETTTYSKGIPILPSAMVKGKSMTVSGTMTTNGKTCSYKATITVDRFETIKVPAGSFRTARVKMVLTTCLGQSTTYYWYAKGIGMIKSASSSSSGTKSYRLLRSYKVN